MSSTRDRLRLLGVQREIDRLRKERNRLILELDGEVGVRELARALGLSAAQVSRIRTAARP